MLLEQDFHFLFAKFFLKNYFIPPNFKELFLFHHDPSHTDSILTDIENKAKYYLKENQAELKKLSSVRMAYEGLTIILS